VDGVRVMLIIGPTGSGKSVHGNAAIALEQKYGGFTYIFDIGGSYESVVELYGGRVDRVGKDGPRVNPFALEPTESNIKFLYSFIKLLLTNGGAELEPEDDDVIHKAVQDMYLLDPENRRLSNLFLPKKLDRYLSKWVGKGIYNAVFDNVEDSLSLSRLSAMQPPSTKWTWMPSASRCGRSSLSSRRHRQPRRESPKCNPSLPRRRRPLSLRSHLDGACPGRLRFLAPVFPPWALLLQERQEQLCPPTRRA